MKVQFAMNLFEHITPYFLSHASKHNMSSVMDTHIYVYTSTVGHADQDVFHKPRMS